MTDRPTPEQNGGPPVVSLDHKPRGVGGRGYLMLRYRYHGLVAGRAKVFGPLVHAGDDEWLPDPTRRVRFYYVPAETIIQPQPAETAS
jgi:hypothetical protein